MNEGGRGRRRRRGRGRSGGSEDRDGPDDRRERAKKRRDKPPKPWTEARLERAAMAHLARFPSSEARLREVLVRKLRRGGTAPSSSSAGAQGPTPPATEGLPSLARETPSGSAPSSAEARARTSAERELARAARLFDDERDGGGPDDAREAKAGRAPSSLPSLDEAAAWIDPLVERLRHAGLLDDDALARGLTRSFRERGFGRRAVAAKLRAKGLSRDVIDRALDAADAAASADPELLAALKLARRKRLGPFVVDDATRADPRAQRRALAAFARAGLSYGVARRVLDLPDRDTADALLREGEGDGFGGWG